MIQLPKVVTGTDVKKRRPLLHGPENNCDASGPRKASTPKIAVRQHRSTDNNVQRIAGFCINTPFAELMACRFRATQLNYTDGPQHNMSL